MAILFPTALDNFINPTSTTPLNAAAGLRHSEQHGKLNDSIEAIEAKVGIDYSNVNNSIDYITKLYLMTQTQHQDGGYREIEYIPNNSVVPSKVRWYKDSSKVILLIEKQFTYGSNKILPLQITLKLYSGTSDNSLKRTINDVISYNKVFEVSRMRTVT
jgi:hypothetical protein